MKRLSEKIISHFRRKDKIIEKQDQQYLEVQMQLAKAKNQIKELNETIKKVNTTNARWLTTMRHQREKIKELENAK